MPENNRLQCTILTYIQEISHIPTYRRYLTYLLTGDISQIFISWGYVMGNSSQKDFHISNYITETKTDFDVITNVF